MKLADFMAFLRRERRAVLILAVGCLALQSFDDWVDAGLALNARNWDGAWHDLQQGAVSVMMAWAVYRRPAKWGFRIGILGLCAGGFVVVAGAPLLWWIWRHQPDLQPPFSELYNASWWAWTEFVLSLLGGLVVAGACLSLRWLYPEYRPTLRAEIERLEREKAVAGQVANA